ncbi:MAG: hypothetical protein ABI051_13625 [Vicinamibacterales bacterium]
MKTLFASVCVLLAGVGYLAIRKQRLREEQSPEPQVPRYRYTTERTYDQDKAIAAARLARTRTPSGRRLRKPRQAAANKKADVFSIMRRRRA